MSSPMSEDGSLLGHDELDDEGYEDMYDGIQDDDDDDGMSNVPDAFEEFHAKASKRIQVLLVQTDDKMHDTYATLSNAMEDGGGAPSPQIPNADDNCFRHWAQGACYLRVRGQGIDIPPEHQRAASVIACTAPFQPSPIVPGTPSFSNPLEVRGVASRLHAPLVNDDDNPEEILAIDGILDEPILVHHTHDTALSSNAAAADDDDVGRGAVLILLSFIVAQCPRAQALLDPTAPRRRRRTTLARHDLPMRTNIAPHIASVFGARGTQTHRVARLARRRLVRAAAARDANVGAPPDDVAAPTHGVRCRLDPRERLKCPRTSHFVPVLAARDIDRGARRVHVTRRPKLFLRKTRDNPAALLQPILTPTKKCHATGMTQPRNQQTEARGATTVLPRLTPSKPPTPSTAARRLV
ncbi:Aste57867_2513 [Aphanomyces stellatus]|uniref:Aste57867_2513 protein n=1 Tax=Aphanomyces stellatus TaxID=120398 RepID=A0A485KCX1_9STRA|nr:hypothetical protein As57867_002506 [Aphanomyces stellatus]VFT79712.1 Aste57867_2513 [Aphanomyces stellatus]